MSIVVAAAWEPWAVYYPSAALTLERWTSAGTLLAGPDTLPGEAEALPWTASAVLSANTVLLTVSATGERWTAGATMPFQAELVAEPWSASARIDLSIGVAASWERWHNADLSAAPSAERWAAAVTMAAGVAATFHVAAMNAKTKAVTEYTNYPFNSFAKIGSVWFAAGDGGLYRLGDSDTDNGTQVNWALRTGQHDDNKVVLKRIPEVVVGLRSNGYVTVRVHADDNTYYDYTLPKFKPTTIHQHRVQPGKGMRSRWYSTELRGKSGADLELASLQMNMTETTRRLG